MLISQLLIPLCCVHFFDLLGAVSESDDFSALRSVRGVTNRESSIRVASRWHAAVRSSRALALNHNLNPRIAAIALTLAPQTSLDSVPLPLRPRSKPSPQRVGQLRLSALDFWDPDRKAGVWGTGV